MEHSGIWAALLGPRGHGDSVVKNLPANAGDLGLVPGWEIPWRRKWLSTLVFLSGEFHGQRSLVGYSPWVAKSQTRLS